MYNYMVQSQPQYPPRAKLHVVWGNGVGMVTYVSNTELYDAEHKVPHMMRNMTDVIALAAKRGAMHV